MRSFEKLFKYKPNFFYFISSLLMFSLTLIIYFKYYDILIPGLPNGSYRIAIGTLFLLPSFLLAGGQIAFGGFFLHMMTTAIKGEGDLLKAIFITSCITLFFSITYVIFPLFGPFYYIVFVTGGPWYALYIELLWTGIIFIFGSFMIRKLYNIEYKISLLFTICIYVFITVAAS